MSGEKILVVDDDARYSGQVCQHLSRNIPNISLLEACTEKDAMNLYRSNTPRIVLTDTYLGEFGGDGRNLAKSIRQYEGENGLPSSRVVLMSAPKRGESLEYDTAIIDDFFNKLHGLDQLLARLGVQS